MAPPALCLPFNAIRNLLSGKYGMALITPVLAVAFVFGMVWDDIENSYAASISSDANSDVVVLSFANAGTSAAGDSELILLVDFNVGAETCQLDSTLAISLLALAGAADERMSVPISLRTESRALDLGSAVFASASVDLFSYARQETLPKFTTAYQSVLRLAALIGLSSIQDEPALTRTTIVGTVSTYNPYRDGKEEGGAETASGELYDPTAWTAAIQTGFRDQFGGVRYGKLYRPAYALVASGEKRVIVKVNDVGPLKAGRVLDLNERSMRFFDPFLSRGLIQDAKITLLPGEDWTPGPVGEAYAIDFAAARRPQPVEASNEQTEMELANMRARLGHAPEPDMKADARAEVKLSGG